MAIHTLALATILALSCTISVNSLDINIQPLFPGPREKDVIITCAGANETKKMLEKMFRIRLMRLEDDGQSTDIALLRYDGSIDLTEENATAVGRLGDVFDSYLAVHWPVAPDDINGRYRCDAIALTSSGDIVTEESKELEVRDMPSDMLLLLERLKKSEKRLVGRVNQTMYGVMKDSRANFFSALDSKFGDIREYLDNKTTVTVSTEKPEVEVETIIAWPEGRFTLLMSSAGCPLHPPAWVKGFKKMKLPPGDKFYPLNVPLHLANPHKKDGFIYRQFCTLPPTPERVEPWPARSYCLYTSDSTKCPTGFTYAESKVKILSDTDNFYLYYFPNASHKSGSFSISASRFCCRHDGSASNAIDLPVSHPFYLFRHGGMCQEVKGMDVIQDVFIMETVDDVDYDKWTDSNPDFRPDASFQPYKEELCYYSRSKHV